METDYNLASKFQMFKGLLINIINFVYIIIITASVINSNYMHRDFA